MDIALISALHATIGAHMSDAVRPTPSAQWLGQRPLVAHLAKLIEVVVTDTDGAVVTPVDAILASEKGRHLEWDSLHECYRVKLHHAKAVVPVIHLQQYVAAMIVVI